MIGNLVIFGDSYSTYKGHIPEGYAHYYSPEEAPVGNEEMRIDLEDTWWRRFIKCTGANLIRNDSWSGSTICYTGYDGDCSTTSSFIYRYRQLLAEDFFKKNTVDTVIVFGGTNDSWCPAELGERKLVNQGEEDLRYVLPAISHIMSSMKSDLPNTRIVYIANCGIDDAIIDCMVDEGERLGIEVVKIHDVDKQNDHPTIRGMQEICDQVTSALGE